MSYQTGDSADGVALSTSQVQRERRRERGSERRVKGVSVDPNVSVSIDPNVGAHAVRAVGGVG